MRGSFFIVKLLLLLFFVVVAPFHGVLLHCIFFSEMTERIIIITWVCVIWHFLIYLVIGVSNFFFTYFVYFLKISNIHSFNKINGRFLRENLFFQLTQTFKIYKENRRPFVKFVYWKCVLMCVRMKFENSYTCSSSQWANQCLNLTHYTIEFPKATFQRCEC